jgi:hypothetical protein
LDKLAPIVLFVYNRLEHTRTTIDHLLKNRLADKSTLIIFSDGPKREKDEKKIIEVRKYIKSITGFQNVQLEFREKNLGLANSVINGVESILNLYNEVIVLEDDVISSPYFLTFMNNALNFYRNDKSIFSVSGYPYPIKFPESYTKDVFISYRPSSWGWGTWKDRWKSVDWDVRDYKYFIKDKSSQKLFERAGQDLLPMLIAQKKGQIDSWAVKWGYAHYKNSAFCLYPVLPLCKNIGTDRSGTHSSSSNKLSVVLENEVDEIKMDANMELNTEINLNIKKLFKPSLLRRIINYFKYGLI